MEPSAAPIDRDGFEIAIVCALKLERDAIEALMDVDFKDRGRAYGKASQDRNTYTTGLLGGKAVVLAYPGAMGVLNAATVASDMRHSFKNIKLGLVVGVAGGAPRTPNGSDILLGDVVISTAVIQYDFGRQYPDSFKRKRGVESTLGRASAEVANFLAFLEGDRVTNRMTAKMNRYNRNAVFTSKFAHPGIDHDHLYPSEYRHKHHDPQMCLTCRDCYRWNDPVCAVAESAGCEELGCDNTMVIYRHSQASRPAQIHFGRFASGNGVIRSAFHRDKLAAKEEVSAFEMEGAGTWDQMPTLIVKSICDYADSHKDKLWQGFAAITAASCAKAILEEWEMSDRPSNSIPSVVEVTNASMRLRSDDHTDSTFSRYYHYEVRLTVARPTRYTLGLPDLFEESTICRSGLLPSNVNCSSTKTVHSWPS